MNIYKVSTIKEYTETFQTQVSWPNVVSIGARKINEITDFLGLPECSHEMPFFVTS